MASQPWSSYESKTLFIKSRVKVWLWSLVVVGRTHVFQLVLRRSSNDFDFSSHIIMNACLRFSQRRVLDNSNVLDTRRMAGGSEKWRHSLELLAKHSKIYSQIADCNVKDECLDHEALLAALCVALASEQKGPWLLRPQFPTERSRKQNCERTKRHMRHSKFMMRF